MSSWQEVAHVGSPPRSATLRMKVLGGWLVSHGYWGEFGCCESMCFVADLAHKWRLEGEEPFKVPEAIPLP